MRLGGPVSGAVLDPDRWVAELLARGYGAAYCPVDIDADDDTVRAFSTAAGAAAS